MVETFWKQILMADETRFTLNFGVNKQNLPYTENEESTQDQQNVNTETKKEVLWSTFPAKRYSSQKCSKRLLIL